ncbi:hypothetical protein GCM10020295_81550 [Streptomyces cinereospinus]
MWGGHKGSGLALVVQLLGMACGAATAPHGVSDCGFLLMVVDPGLFTDADDFRRRAADYAELLRATRPTDAERPVRVPFERSAAERERRRARGTIEVSDDVCTALSNAASPTLGGAVNARTPAVAGAAARIGPVGVWWGSHDRVPADQVRAAAAEAERLGYGALWIGEAPGGREVFTHAALLLDATRHITVAPRHRQHLAARSHRRPVGGRRPHRRSPAALHPGTRRQPRRRPGTDRPPLRQAAHRDARLPQGHGRQLVRGPRA